MNDQLARDREKLRQDNKANIEDLEYKRKNDQEEFMKKHRQMYDQHLMEIKKVRDDYQDRIRILEGSREKLLEGEREMLQIKYGNISKEEIEKSKREQLQKIEAAYSKLDQQYERKQE